MRYFLLIMCLLSFCGIFSCADNENNITNPENNLLMYMIGDYTSFIRTDSGWVKLDKPKFQISGTIIAETIVIPEYLQFGDIVYDHSDINFSTNLGSVTFQKFIEDIEVKAYHVELKTSQGSISGEMMVPAIISDISFSDSTIHYNNEFTVSWKCANVTYYKVNYYIEIDQFPGYALYVVDTLTDSSISILLGNDYYANKYFQIEIQPLNIPILEVGSKGNMEGDGSGFISCYGITSSARKFVY